MLQIFLIKCPILHCEVSRLMPLWLCWIKMTRSAMKQKEFVCVKVHSTHFFPFGNKNVAKVMVFHRNVSTAICLQKSA